MTDLHRLRKILDCPMGKNDADAATVRDYLLKLLTLVWDEGEEFDGKRPFGNSGWAREIKVALIQAGLAKGSVDSHGYLEDVYTAEVAALVKEAIATLGTDNAVVTPAGYQGAAQHRAASETVQPDPAVL